MPKIRACPLPDNALLQTYAVEGTHTDCYVIEVDHCFSQVEFVSAFYTTWLFKLERWILGWAIRRPSTDAQARELAQGLCKQFAAWDVEDRSEDQLLLCDLNGRTRSWLMTVAGAENSQSTRLYFGSAVVPRVDRVHGKASLGWIYRSLLGFHKIYSRLLLGAASRRLGALSSF